MKNSSRQDQERLSSVGTGDRRTGGAGQGNHHGVAVTVWHARQAPVGNRPICPELLQGFDRLLLTRDAALADAAERNAAYLAGEQDGDDVDGWSIVVEYGQPLPIGLASVNVVPGIVGCEGSGVGYDALARFLDEHRDIRVSTVEKLAEFFGMNALAQPSQPPVKRTTKH